MRSLLYSLFIPQYLLLLTFTNICVLVLLTAVSMNFFDYSNQTVLSHPNSIHHLHPFITIIPIGAAKIDLRL
jgi:hypothetical protein